MIAPRAPESWAEAFDKAVDGVLSSRRKESPS